MTVSPLRTLKRDSSIALKTFSISVLVLLSFGCSQKKADPLAFEKAQPVEVEEPHIAPLAPWDIWQPQPEFVIASELEEQGQLQAALRRYEMEPGDLYYKTTRKFGVLLKQGRSKEMLDALSGYLEENNMPISRAPSELAFLAAFAYVGLNDSSQSLAWFALATKKSKVGSPISEISISTAENIIGGVSDIEFSDIWSRWKSDEELSEVVKQERIRRSKGFSPSVAGLSEYQKYYNSSFYSEIETVRVASLEPVKKVEADYKLGAILPLTGQYARFASSVRNGIELAVREKNQEGFDVDVLYLDSAGQAASAGQAYRNLATKGVSVVAGPMLTDSALNVSKLASGLGVPFVSFSKSPGVPQSSDYAFRLGVTAKDQAVALANHAFNKTGARSYAVFSSRGAVAEELTSSFVEQIRFLGGEARIIKSHMIDVSLLGGVEALFFSSSLKSSLPLILELQNFGMKGVTILGPASWGQAAELEQAGELINGAIIAHPFDASSSRANVKDFVYSYREAFNASPTLLEAQAYDAASLALDALLLAADERPVRERLFDYENFLGVTGKLSVQINGEISRDVGIGYISGGKVFEVR